MQHQHLHHKAIENNSIGIQIYLIVNQSHNLYGKWNCETLPNLFILITKFICSFGRTKVKGKKMKACIIETSSTL